MTHPAELIGLIGKKRTGKNHAARLLARFGYEEAAFADPLRDLASAINPIVGHRTEECWDYGYGGELVRVGDEVIPVYYNDAIAAYGYERAKEVFPGFREFLQRLGTEGIRNTLGDKYGLRELLGDDVWIVLAEKRIDAADKPLVFTDVRFPNEAALIARKGGTTVRIVRPELPASEDEHASETALDDYATDVELINPGTAMEYSQAVDNLIDAIA
ncbi:deoxynucleoside monophosphate kinase [Microbacterium phage Barnstormer]|uniref:Deoxynucleoside monophosphate kinase n=1 Tax=Microbacterium phage Barnstormer TaxID=3028491 RepID=A0AAE9ZNE7_9CAUD|nr:deoxynucleoside monophosphate kinase [Microbacterium phage Barnstormer]WDS52130.1 deoxynucleoside monophosphate kinase [Microbacterium phage UtzChips]